MVAENYFYKPVLQKLRKILATDIIGDIKFLYFNATKKTSAGRLAKRKHYWRRSIVPKVVFIGLILWLI
ncbi:MAG: hypothetical protein R2788_14875 [Saprospiraceae bacterium]